MERAMSGLFWICCTLLAVVLQVCLASVTVNVNPEVQVLKGDTVRLPCTYTTSAEAAVVVQWFIEFADGSRKQVAYKSTVGIDAGTVTDRYAIEKDMSLTISQVTVDDHKKFICQVTAGPVGSAESATKVEVFSAPEKPVVAANPQNIFVGPSILSSSEVGKCISRNGHPEPRIIWFKDDNPLPEEKKTTEKTYMLPFLVKEASGLYTMTSTLYMHLTKADAKSVYHCTVEYAMPDYQIKQESSDNFNISLQYSAENVFFKVKKGGPIKEGDDVVMQCETDGNPQPEFDFYKEEEPRDGLGGTLKIKNITRKDSGTYKCEALDFDADSKVQLSKTLNINVHYIDITVEPKEPLVVSKGDSVELQCKASTSEAHTLQWTKDSKELSNTGVFTKESVTLADGGVYVCVGTIPSVPGLQKQVNITVNVKGQPEIDAPVNGLVDKEGAMVTLNCSALGHPAPQFTWTPSGKESVTVKGNRVISTVTLEATAAVLKDGVICEAYNTHGRDSKNFKVSKKPDPAEPTVANSNRAERKLGGSSSVVIAVVVCVLLLLILVASLFFLNKKGKLSCGKKDKKEVASGGMKDNIVVEIKPTDKSKEEAGLLKPAEQC
ncbi:basal cell adhesion molecule isoform X2 [Danio aesculapii]|uniref:basal cell adhesion molecule isoform X2 n=1 Tax=Danio aesculapii TaxID=1142201 RepID=UPI0024C0BBE0|nr:basal cell adhesion molecule isoform X2 [Danio aesculapii]